jgi:hypothetical protein
MGEKENKENKEIIGENNKKFCPFCGEDLEENAIFCASCGQPLPGGAGNPDNPEERKTIYQKPEGFDKKWKKSPSPPHPPRPPHPHHHDDDDDDDDDGDDEDDDDDDDDDDNDRTINLKIGPERIKFRQSSDKDDSTVRLNISVPGSKRKEWKTLAASLGESVSELVREAMGALQAGITGEETMDEFGRKMEKWGRKIEKTVKASGIEDIGKKIEKDVEKNIRKVNRKLKRKYRSVEEEKEDMERIKKRIQGLIKLQGEIPISKLSQALEISEEDAENLIYELAAEGIEGKLEEGVFKYTTNEDEVISKLFKIIDQL